MQEQRTLDNQATYLRYSVTCLLGAETHNLGKILSCSINSFKYLGYTTQQLLGKNINSLMPPTIASFHDEALKSKLQNKEGKMFNFF